MPGRVADETETAAFDNLARQPPGNEPDDQYDNQPLVRQMHLLPFGPSLRFATQSGSIAMKVSIPRQSRGL